jgi:pyrimidine operon attenuation protein / uracil phosphoribosyltransferase
MNAKCILTAAQAAQKINRMALEIIEDHFNEKELVLIGIKNNGLVLAETLHQQLQLQGYANNKIIQLHLANEQVSCTDMAIENIAGKAVIICDDVANSGKTQALALQFILGFKPKAVATMVLVERSHKQFPIYINYKGLTISTTIQEHIEVAIANNAISDTYLQVL